MAEEKPGYYETEVKPKLTSFTNSLVNSIKNIKLKKTSSIMPNQEHVELADAKAGPGITLQPTIVVPVILTEEDRKRLRFEKYENALLMLRIGGGIVMTWDITLKIAYYEYNRFASLDVKQLYLCFLWFRPLLLALVTFYNMLLGLKTKLVSWEKSNKKFKDDIAYLRELAAGEGSLGSHPALQDGGAEVGQLYLFYGRQLVLLVLSYTGFSRLMTKEKHYNFRLLFGHTFEIFS